MSRTKKPSVSLDTATCAAQTSIFLWNGFMDALGIPGGVNPTTPKGQRDYDRHFDARGQGQDGGATHMAMYAIAIETEWAAKWRQRESPGVYQYEIIEPIGAWLAKHEQGLGGVPPAEVVKKFDELMKVWFVLEVLER